jgi:hypothetical protein
MNVPTSPAGAEKSHPVELDVEAEISKLVERKIPNMTPQVADCSKRITLNWNDWTCRRKTHPPLFGQPAKGWCPNSSNC